MKHAASRELYAYWQERRGKRAAPERADIEPGAIRQVLSDAFILALDGGSGTVMQDIVNNVSHGETLSEMDVTPLVLALIGR